MNSNRSQIKSFIKIFILLLFSITTQQVCAQTDKSSSFTFRTEIEKKIKNKKQIPRRDSLYINFDYGYKDDIIRIKTGDKIFVSDTLNADSFYGFGGKMRIAKADLHKYIDIFFNDTFLKRIKLKPRFSSVHLEFSREEKEFTWRYLRYRFAYL
jgi:hypothetical protein